MDRKPSPRSESVISCQGKNSCLTFPRVNHLSSEPRKYVYAYSPSLFINICIPSLTEAQSMFSSMLLILLIHGERETGCLLMRKWQLLLLLLQYARKERAGARVGKELTRGCCNQADMAAEFPWDDCKVDKGW